MKLIKNSAKEKKRAKTIETDTKI